MRYRPATIWPMSGSAGGAQTEAPHAGQYFASPKSSSSLHASHRIRPKHTLARRALRPLAADYALAQFVGNVVGVCVLAAAFGAKPGFFFMSFDGSFISWGGPSPVS